MTNYSVQIVLFILLITVLILLYRLSPNDYYKTLTVTDLQKGDKYGKQYDVMQLKSGFEGNKISGKTQQIVLLGFGAVQKALCTLILIKEPQIFKQRDILIIEPLDLIYSEIYQKLREFTEVRHLRVSLNQTNYKEVFEKNIYNALVIDLAFRIDTADIIEQCDIQNCLYINTAIDIWPEKQQLQYQSIYDIKQSIMKSRSQSNTAILNFGANPGLVSHFVKASLKELATKSGDEQQLAYIKKNKYNLIAQKQNLTLIQISERDTQQINNQTLNVQSCNVANGVIKQTEPCQMINTWSIIGFLDEAYDNAQISLGTHDDVNISRKYLQSIQRTSPQDIQKQYPTLVQSLDYTTQNKLLDLSTQQYLDKSGQIVFNKKGVELQTRSFEPVNGRFTGYNIPHAECYSLVQYLRVGNEYRPGSHYSYLPCPRCVDMLDYAGNIDRFKLSTYTDDGITKQVLRNDQIQSGFDSLGALLYFRQIVDSKEQIKTLWSGTILNREQISHLGSEVNATTVQVAISVLSAIMWMIQPENQKKGILEPESLPTDYVLAYCKDYLGTVFINHDCTQDFNVKTDQYLDLLVDNDNYSK